MLFKKRRTRNITERLVTDHIPALTSYVGSNLQYKYLNSRYTDWFNKPLDQLIGKTVEEVIGTEAYNQVRHHIDKVLSGELVRYETMMNYANREKVFVRTSLSPDIDNDGKVRGFYVMVEDFSDIEASYKKLAQLDKAKSEFLKIISHELNTPLNGILGFGHILKENLEGTDQEPYVNMLLESAQRLIYLTNTALLITQLNASIYQINPVFGDIVEMVKNCILSKSDLIKEKSLNIRNFIPDTTAGICFEEKLIKLSIEKIIENAARFAGIGATLTIEAKEEPGETSIIFNDDGPGFSEEYLRYLLEFFASFDSSTVADKRYGLGLAFVKLVMEAHNGNLSITNNDQGGACLNLTFINNLCPISSETAS